MNRKDCKTVHQATISRLSQSRGHCFVIVSGASTADAMDIIVSTKDMRLLGSATAECYSSGIALS